MPQKENADKHSGTKHSQPRSRAANVHFHFMRASRQSAKQQKEKCERKNHDKSIQIYVNSKVVAVRAMRACTEYKFSFFTCGFMSIFISVKPDSGIEIRGGQTVNAPFPRSPGFWMALSVIQAANFSL